MMKKTGSGVRGSRTDAIAMIPTKAGNIKLPTIRYPWFDTESQQFRVAEIPERILNISPSANATALSHSAAPALTEQQPPSSDQSQDCSVIEAAQQAPDHNHWHWYLITSALLLLWLGTAGLWWYTRNNLVQKPKKKSRK